MAPLLEPLRSLCAKSMRKLSMIRPIHLWIGVVAGWWFARKWRHRLLVWWRFVDRKCQCQLGYIQLPILCDTSDHSTGASENFGKWIWMSLALPNTYAELEIINMSHDILTHFGATDSMFTIRVNDRRRWRLYYAKLFRLSDGKTTRMIKLLDRYDKLPSEAFHAGSMQDSGWRWNPISRLMNVIQSEQLDDLPNKISDNEITRPLRELLDKLHQRGLDNIYYNVRLMRGFDYYTGIVFGGFWRSTREP